ncbi:MAG: phosphatidate cytidylyltransferase [Anaerolineales bacterium]|nr:phosphatidate cytidylyltransferase [Anaerolineales bacterium]
MIKNPILATIVIFLLTLTWLRIIDFLAHRGWLETKLSRKVIHIGTGPIFVLCWMLYPPVPSARYLAALVPLAITGQFVLVGTGLMKDEAAVAALSRTGDRREILKGPLYYGIIFVLITIFYWHDSPIGITALMALCGGDGLADVLGRRFGKGKLPWSASKSWMGTFGMFAGSWLLAIFVMAVLSSTGLLTSTLAEMLFPVTIICLAATLVESLPIREIDNITVTLTALILGHLLF